MNSKEITDLIMSYMPKLVLAILTLIVGFWIIKRLSKFVYSGFLKSGMDDTFAKFLSSLVIIALKILLLFSVAGMVGINTTSFIAILAALMVGIGMALNGSIGHLASGVLLMIFKPFKVGDVVTIGGDHLGKVLSIDAFCTVLATHDNRRIIVANSNVTGNTITNISGQGTVGVDLTFGIGYTDDIDKARDIILRVAKSCTTVLDDPATAVVVSSLGDSSVNLSTRPFCKSENLLVTKFYMLEEVKKAFDNEGISIPFPQLDIHHQPMN